MEIVSGRPGSFWSFAGLCAATVLPYYVISKFISNGSYPASPAAILMIAETIKAAISWALASPIQNEPVQAVDDGDSGSVAHGRQNPLPKKLLAQLGGLSLLYTLTMILFLVAMGLTSAGSFILLQTTSVWVAGLIGIFYLQDWFTPQQWLVISIHLAGIVAAQWNACSSSSISPFWQYVLLFVVIFLQQFTQTWYGALLRHAGVHHHMLGMLLSMFTIPLAGWIWFSLPEDVFSVVPSSSFFSASTFFPTLAISMSLAISSIIQGSVMAQPTNSQLAVWMVPVVGTWILYLSDWLSGTAYVTLTVLIGLSTASISVYSFLAFSNDAICVKPGFRRNHNPGIANTLLAAFPDFVLVKCGWKHFCGTILVLFFLLIVFQQGPGGDERMPTLKSNLSLPVSVPVPEAMEPPRHIDSNLPKNAKLMYVSHPSTLNDFVEWRERDEDEAEQRDSLVDLYWSKRDPNALNKTTAVCLAGNMRLGYADDLEWLHTLYRTIGSYDLFVWQGPESQPLLTGLLKPRFVSMGRSPGAPTGMNRRFKNRGGDNDDWAIHLWGFGHCVTVINKHIAKTGASYDFLLLSLPNSTFSKPPIPKQQHWDLTSLTFMPSDIIMEKVLFGPYKAVSAFAPLLHSSIMSWTGSKAPRDYARHLAKSKGYSIQELT